MRGAGLRHKLYALSGFRCFDFFARRCGAVRGSRRRIYHGRKPFAGGAILTLDVVPGGDLPVKLTTSDPARVLLSTSPEKEGVRSITITVRAGARFTPEFYVQGLASSGEAAYTASATGWENVAGIVTLAPSGLFSRDRESAGTCCARPPAPRRKSVCIRCCSMSRSIIWDRNWWRAVCL